MRELLSIIKEHRIIAICIICVLVVFIAWSAFQFIINHSDSDIKTSDKAQKTITADDPVSASVQKADNKITESQKKTIKGYTDREKELLAMLKNNTWITENQTASLKFTDTVFTEMVGADIESHPYSIIAVTDYQIIGDSVTYESEIFAVRTDEKAFIIKKWHFITPNGNASEWKITSDGFSKGTEYIRTAVSSDFEVRGLNEDVCDLYGGYDNLTKSIMDFVSLAYPTAGIATWREDAHIDYKNNLVTTTFTLNTKTSSVITVKYYKSTGEILME